MAELARSYEVDRSWVYRRLARFRAEGESGLELRSKRPHRSPSRITDLFEDEIVASRKELADAGFDAGAETIRYHLSQRHRDVPSVSTIWRVLKARVPTRRMSQDRKDLVGCEYSIPAAAAIGTLRKSSRCHVRFSVDALICSGMGRFHRRDSSSSARVRRSSPCDASVYSPRREMLSA